MATNDLGSIDYGFRLGNTPMGAWMQAEEDNYKRQARTRAAQQQEEEFKRQQEKDKASADYMRAQADYMRDNIGARKELAEENNVLKRQQAAQEQVVRARPLVMAIQDQVKKSQSGDMAALYKAAELHKQMEENFPEAAKVLSAGKQRQPNKFQLSQGGQTQEIQSQLDPETFPSFANNWPKDKVTGQVESTGIRADASQENSRRTLEGVKYAADARQKTQSALLSLRASIKNKELANKFEARLIQAQDAVDQAIAGGEDPAPYMAQLDQLVNLAAVFAQTRNTTPQVDLNEMGVPTTSPSKETQKVKPKQGSRENPIKLD